jgi:glycosyltransferase involved in cell wall biosynthesis
MKIAQVSPLFESVPPKLYGGTERVVSYLTEELVALGHEVTLFASGDSVTGARLCPQGAASLRLNDACEDHLPHHFLLLEKVFQHAGLFDIIHFHTDYLHFPLVRRLDVPHLTTLHGRLDLPDLVPLYQEFRDVPVVSISDSQQTPLPWANWLGTVYHGLPIDLFPFNSEPDRYLAFLGRISPEKGLERAIDIAVRCAKPLKIAAKVDKADREYFEAEIRPRLDHPLIEFIGEIDDREKPAFLSKAYALLFPIAWQEPFGLVMIEAMACGTPVIAWLNGSVPEVMREGVSGFIVDDLESAVRAVDKVKDLSRRDCRHYFEERFSARRMAGDYLAIYQQILDSTRGRARLAVT